MRGDFGNSYQSPTGRRPLVTAMDTLLRRAIDVIVDTPEQLVPCKVEITDPKVDLHSYAWRLDLDEQHLTIRVVVDSSGSTAAIGNRRLLSVPANRVEVFHEGRRITGNPLTHGYLSISFKKLSHQDVEGLDRALRALLY